MCMDSTTKTGWKPEKQEAPFVSAVAESIQRAALLHNHAQNNSALINFKQKYSEPKLSYNSLIHQKIFLDQALQTLCPNYLLARRYVLEAK